MRKIKVSDVTMKQKAAAALTFREKLELVKLLDRLCADVIEIAPLTGKRADSLCAKSIAQTLQNAVLAVPAGLTKETIDRAWEAVGEAKAPRLQIVCPTSSVQMEYLYHCKPAQMQQKTIEAIRYCRSLCDDVEFVAGDATRSDRAYLYSMLNAAASAGAGIVTVSDDAGNMLPDEYQAFLSQIIENTEALKNGSAQLSVCCSDKLRLANICSVGGASLGAQEIKASIFPEDSANLCELTRLLTAKAEELGLTTGVQTVEMTRIVEKATHLFTQNKSKNSPFDDGVRDEREKKEFSAQDSIEVIIREAKRLGYDLNDEDNRIVYDTFLQIAGKKSTVSDREIEAIIASSAMQVPPTYRLKDFIINSGNTIAATCHMRLLKNDGLLESVAIGDGPVDASFLAIEHITGHHYELDDFQIRSVTEGRTAMGETIVKLRADGKLYSGRGISTDVVGSSIYAYINALNKIVYEEENA